MKLEYHFEFCFSFITEYINQFLKTRSELGKLTVFPSSIIPSFPSSLLYLFKILVLAYACINYLLFPSKELGNGHALMNNTITVPTLMYLINSWEKTVNK